MQHASTNFTTLPIGRVAISTSQIYKVRFTKNSLSNFGSLNLEQFGITKHLHPLNQNVSTTSDFVNNLQYHKSKIVTFNPYGIEIAILRKFGDVAQCACTCWKYNTCSVSDRHMFEMKF